MSKKQGRSFLDYVKVSAQKPFETWKKKPKKPSSEQGGASSASGTVASGVAGCSGASQQAHHDQGSKQGGVGPSASGGVTDGASGGMKQGHYDKGNTSDLTSHQEKTNYSRLCRLLISVGSRVLRDTFDKIIPPQNLQNNLKRHPVHSKLQSRRKERILNSMQWSKLYPATPSEVSSAGFDLALLIVLLRTICNLSPPPAGWDAPPLTADTRHESDIARVKYFMNAVSKHAGEGSVSDAVFSNYWQQIRDTLVRLGGGDYEDATDEMKDQEMDPLDEEHFQELLNQWKEVEDNMKNKLNELESMEATEGEGSEQGGVSSTSGTVASGAAGCSGASQQAHHDQGNTSDLTSRQEKTNYSRLCHLLISVGSRVLRSTFDKIIPPQNLQNILKCHTVHSKLQSRRKEGILNSMQWSKLYPATPSEVSSAGFDLALLIVLLRAICNLSPPPAGWDAPPHTADTSHESDIARVKYFMNAVSKHAVEGSVSDAVFSNYWQQIRDTLVRLGGGDYEDAIDEMKDQEMDLLDEEHFQELLKQWKEVEDNIKDKLNELESKEASEEEDVSHQAHIIERIRQLYKTREERVLPLPWCEHFSFHLNDIFTRLKIVGKKKTRGELTDEITDMTAIFKGHADCQKPRTVLIEGEPGMGKTTYCQKLAYDWATKQDEWDESFPEIEVLLLLKCHEIELDIWKAIDEQILPVDIDDEDKESFFKFIRKNQSKILLVLDGMDEADPKKLAMYCNLVQSKELPGCHIVLTSRHETGMKVRPYCNSLWEIIGFTQEDARRYIYKYFKNMKALAEKLLVTIWPRTWDLFDEPSHGPPTWPLTRNQPRVSYGLKELTQNPLNTALLCVVWEDLEGVIPTNRAQLYMEIVRCVLRRYEEKYGLSSKSDDLMTVYKEQLKHLGRMALQSLRKGEFYFEEHEFHGNSIVLSKFGFLSIQAGGSKRKRSSRYGFLHKSFQEFFAGLYLAFQIIDGEINCDSVVTDQRYRNELDQVFLFMSGILALQSEEAVVSLVKSLTVDINLISRTSGDHVSNHLDFALSCISECTTNEGNIPSRLCHILGEHLDVKTLKVNRMWNIVLFFEALAANSSLTNLDLRWNKIGPSGVTSLSDVLAANSSMTNLNLDGNKIGPSGAASLSDVLAANSSLTNLDLSYNEIGPSGAASLSDALAANSSLTNLNLRGNKIGSSGAASLSDALAANSSLTNLDLRGNKIGSSGAASLSDVLAANSSLTNLDLRGNMIGPSGAASLSDALAANSSLSNLDLSDNMIGPSGVASLSDALAANSSLSNLDLSDNKIGPSGVASLSDALAANSSLTKLDLSYNEIGSSGAASLCEALAANSSLTNLDLSNNNIGPSGAVSLSKVLAANSLNFLNLRGNYIGSSGVAYLSYVLAANSSLTYLNLRGNEIGPNGAASLSDVLAANSSLTYLNLRGNKIGPSGVTSLSDVLAANSSLTNLNLDGNKIGPSGAASLSDVLAANSSLTNLDLSYNEIGSSGAASLCNALAANSSLTYLNLRGNKIGSSGAASLSDVLATNSSLTYLNLRSNEIGPSGVASLSDVLAANSSLTYLNLSYNEIGSSGVASLIQALATNSSLCKLDLRWNHIGAFNVFALQEACKINTTVKVLLGTEKY